MHILPLHSYITCCRIVAWFSQIICVACIARLVFAQKYLKMFEYYQIFICTTLEIDDQDQDQRNNERIYVTTRV